jgi:predicted enzyme related to lactoylglutathione lyase
VARKQGRDVAGIGAMPPGSSPHAVWTTYVAVSDVDDAVSRATEAGGAMLAPPFDALPAGRAAVIADPAGAAIGLWEPADRAGARTINEHSAWAMSLLNTPDPDGACVFYDAVFGWQAETMETGGPPVWLYRLPGYVGGEPEQPVARDVVAAMIALPPDAAAQGVPAHWAVDFWIADAEGAAQRAPGLGGSVLVAPYDQPPFRRSVIADPFGAAFAVSTLTV